jgi:hypothetical protein
MQAVNAAAREFPRELGYHSKTEQKRKKGATATRQQPPQGYLGICNGLVDSSFFDFFKRLLGFLAPM